MASKVRNSMSHPLRVDFVQPDNQPGLIGMTLCPGKHQRNALSGSWERDLGKDLQAIVECGASTLVTLLEEQELEALEVPELGKCSQTIGLNWYHLPIRDGDAPGDGFESHWKSIGRQLRWSLRNGETVVMHCKGGLGRAGTVAASLLIELGEEHDTAIGRVRKVRPGAIETIAQERYLRRLTSIEGENGNEAGTFGVIHWELKILREKGLAGVAVPMPVALMTEAIEAGGQLQHDITIGQLLDWMQEYVRYAHSDWRDFSVSLLRLAQRMAGESEDEKPETVIFDCEDCWVACTQVAIEQEIVTIQRQGNVLAVFAPTPDGRLGVMAYHPLDAKSLEYICAVATRPNEQGQVCQRENNWEYLKDVSAGMGNIYASDTGEAYLSYWQYGLGKLEDGRLLLGWYRQRERMPVSASITAVQLEVYRQFHS